MHHVYRLQFEGFGTRDNFLSGIQQFFCISSSGCSCTNEWKHQSWLLLHIQYNQYSRKTREWYMANTVSSPIYVIQILTCCFYYIHVFEFRKLVFISYEKKITNTLSQLYQNHIFLMFKCIATSSILKWSDHDVIDLTADMHRKRELDLRYSKSKMQRCYGKV